MPAGPSIPWFAAASVYRVGPGEPSGGRCLAAKLSLARAAAYAAEGTGVPSDLIELRLDDGSRKWAGSEALDLAHDPARPSYL